MSEKKSSPGMWTPANIVTSVRVVFVPVWLLMAQLLGGVGVGGMAVFVAFCLLSLTDKLDGYLARSRNEVTNFGKFMDPIADKLLVMSAFVLLVGDGRMTGVSCIIILAREFIISGFRLIASDRGMVLAAGKLGKIKTTLQIIAIVLLLLNNFPFVYIGIPMDKIVLAAAVVMTVWSGADYIVKNRQILKD